MTTKIKIIIGFITMIFLSMAIAWFGYSHIQAGSEGFIWYRQQAAFNFIASDMATNLGQAMMRVYDFISIRDPEIMEDAKHHLDEFGQEADTALGMIKIPYRRDAMLDLKKQLEPLRAAVNMLESSTKALDKQYESVVQPNCTAMESALSQLGQAAFDFNRIETLFEVEKLWVQYSPLRVSIGRYAATYSEEDGNKAAERIQVFEASLAALGPRLVTDAGKKSYAQLMAAYTPLKEALNVMLENGKKVRNSVAQMHVIEKDIVDKVDALSARVDKEVNAEGDATIARSENGQSIMRMVSVGGVVLGALLAFYSIFGLVRVLRELSSFAGAIAKGEFDRQISVREKGEIGQMVASIKEIPLTLNRVLEEYTNLEAAIERGNLDAKGEPEKFQGGFATLVRGSNAILNRFLSVLESIPSPVAMLDKDLKAVYANAVARSLVGENYKGRSTKEMFAREDADTTNDALKKAVTTKSPASAETRAHPQGKEMDISYTVIPMFSAQGQISSVLQLVTDLTALKTQQKTMLQVASKASEISSRVAAASEELSAQVEQVSRGAEVQRERVEGTASAMTEMNATVLEVAKSAGQASEQSEGTRLKAAEGADLVNQVVAAINEVNIVGHNLQTNMQELGKQAESIGSVMNVISDIADQTNLLALNAAIEAARAGEAGRGFAVVADEVRKLAEKTMHATQEVGSSINAVQHSARVNIGEVGKVVEKMSQATTLANSSGSALTKIVDLASANSAVVASIATAAEEQSATSEEISRALGEINQVVAETTDGMTQSSDAVQELSRMAQELRRVMDGLR